MANYKIHIRHIMLYEFRKGTNATVATKNIFEVYGNVLDVHKCERCFAKFRSGDFSLKDCAGRKRQSELDIQASEALV